MTDAEFLEELKRRTAAATTTFLRDHELPRLRSLTERTRYFHGVVASGGQLFSSVDIAGELAIARRLIAAKTKQRLLGKI